MECQQLSYWNTFHCNMKLQRAYLCFEIYPSDLSWFNRGHIYSVTSTSMTYTVTQLVSGSMAYRVTQLVSGSMAYRVT